jgi:hypothetical protein
MSSWQSDDIRWQLTAGADTDLLATTWLVATDIMQSFGVPEARAVTQEGAVRAGWMPSDWQQGLAEFAAGRDVALDDSQPAEAT